MLTKTKSLTISLLIAFSMGAGFSLVAGSVVSAAPIPAGCPGGADGPKAPGTKCPDNKDTSKPYIDPAADPNANCSNDRCDWIKKYVNPFIQLLSVSFGLIAVISLIMGGIQYAGSTGDPQKVTLAKQRIF